MHKDDDRLKQINRVWSEMLREDPWMKKLMTHVRLLSGVMTLLFLVFWVGGMFLPARHQIYNYLCLVAYATFPYWLWVGSWHHKIELKVFESLTHRFGKQLHLY